MTEQKQLTPGEFEANELEAKRKYKREYYHRTKDKRKGKNTSRFRNYNCRRCGKSFVSVGGGNCYQCLMDRIEEKKQRRKESK